MDCSSLAWNRCGAVEPHVLVGRLPVGPGEIAIGRVSARRLDVAIGDLLELTSPATSGTYEITGLVVPHQIQGSGEVGQGGFVTSAGYSRLDPDGTAVGAAFRLRPGADADDMADRIERVTGRERNDIFVGTAPQRS